MNPAAARWSQELAAWAVPREILDAVSGRPFEFPPEMFAAPRTDDRLRSRSTEVAAEALADGGSVLDVGCGGGAAAFALVPPATEVVGSDRQEDMLRLFAATAAERGVPARTVPGSWPDIADTVPRADVVVCHNVLYNAPDILGFVTALHQHARRRVVIEITERHPQVARAPLWRHFWDLDRPTGPDASVAAQALREAGFPLVLEGSTATSRDRERAAPVEATFWCRQLCLPPEREDEVAALLQDHPVPAQRVILWWDTGGARPRAR